MKNYVTCRNNLHNYTVIMYKHGQMHQQNHINAKYLIRGEYQLGSYL